MTDLFPCAKKKLKNENGFRYPSLVEKKEVKEVKEILLPHKTVINGSNTPESYSSSSDEAEETDLKRSDVLPDYPLCKTLYGLLWCDAGYLTCISVFRELGNHTSQIYLRNRLKKSKETGLNIQLRDLIPNQVWSNEDNLWHKIPEQDKDNGDLCVEIKDLQEFIQWAQLRTRKPLLEKQRMFRKFNIELAPEQLKEVKVPIENEVLDFLQRCLPFKMEQQYRVGKYRLDAFIPRLMLGIQIDEHGHKNYNADEEKQYNEVVRDHNIVCIRFNPHEKYIDSDPGMELVRRVWERTLSPDFSTFREKHKLA